MVRWAMPPRFLCDEMLGHLCLYLRAAGYDTLLAERGTPDAALLRQSHNEERIFLSQDARIAEHKAAEGIAFILPHVSLNQLAGLVGKRFRLDWMTRAFTRCLVDNTRLVAADETARLRAPKDVLRSGEPLLSCPVCGRVYWRGSHYRRMSERLHAWQAEFRVS